MGIAHIGHAELRVSDLAASRWFFEEVMGLFVSAEEKDRVYLRAWQDFDHHTLVLTADGESAIDHVAWRVDGPTALQGAREQLERDSVETTWVPAGSELGQGDALRFRSPSGIPLELYWEVEKHVEANPKLRSRLASHPQKYMGRGVAPRRFDHANFLVDDVAAEQAYFSDQLGIPHRYFVEGDSGTRLGSWLSKTNVSHELALMRNRNQNGACLHHVAYYASSPDELMRAATILAENEIPIEWGPGCHGTSGAIFLYCFEPSGHRIEVWTGGMLIFAPDWEPIRWDPSCADVGLEMWGSPMPESYLVRGTPLTRSLVAA